jgi:hypothetical protein
MAIILPPESHTLCKVIFSLSFYHLHGNNFTTVNPFLCKVVFSVFLPF